MSHFDEETKKKINDYIDRRDNAMHHWFQTCKKKKIGDDLRKLVEEQINLSFVDDMTSLYTINMKERRYIRERCEIASYYLIALTELDFTRDEALDIITYGGFT